jgi:hypothetical protein
MWLEVMRQFRANKVRGLRPSKQSWAEANFSPPSAARRFSAHPPGLVFCGVRGPSQTRQYLQVGHSYRDRLRPSPTGQDHLVPRHAGARDGQSALAYACAHCERAPCAPATAPQRRYRDWRWRCHSLPRGRAWRDTARPPLAFASLITEKVRARAEASPSRLLANRDQFLIWT